MEESPQFLGDEWLLNQGWAFAQPIPAHLRGLSASSSSAPWDRLIVILLEAQEGRFEHVSALGELLQTEQPGRLFNAAMSLAGAVGGEAEEHALIQWFSSPWFSQALSATRL